MARKASRTTFDLTNDSLAEPMLKYQRRGFTIVELLIVIVVIAILAAITAVAYSGIQNRARASAAQSAARQAASSISTYAAQNSDPYPANGAAAGLTDTASTTYQYRVDNTASPRTFCVTATTNSISYYSSSTTTSPTSGACAGHGANGAVAVSNLVLNPSVRSDTSNWTNWAAGAATSFTGRVATGGPPPAASFYRVTVSSAPNQSPLSITALNVPAEPGKYYCVSGYVRAATAYNGGIRIQFDTRNSSNTSLTTYSGASAARTPAEWNRLTYCSPTATDAGTVTVNVTAAFSGPNGVAAGTTSDFAGVMVSEGTTSPAYGDGDSPGWAWNGAPNNSTSSGPPL